MTPAGTFRAFVWTVLAAFAAGCASPAGSVTLPRLPAWIAPADAREFSNAEVRAAALALVPGAIVNVGGQRYTRVSKRWLDAYLAWCWSAGAEAGVTYTPESFDCKGFT